MWRAIVIGMVAVITVVKPAYGTEPSVGISYGDNIWGKTLGLAVDVPLSTKWVVQLTHSTGHLAFTTRDRGDFLFYVDNLPGEEHRISLDIKRFVDIALVYQRNAVSEVHIFNEFGVGIAHVFARLRSEFEKEDDLTTFRGERDYSEYGVIATANVIDFQPDIAGDVLFSLGIRSRLFWMDSPQVLHYTDGAGRIDTKTLSSRHGDTIYFLYPELFFAAKYSF